MAVRAQFEYAIQLTGHFESSLRNLLGQVILSPAFITHVPRVGRRFRLGVHVVLWNVWGSGFQVQITSNHKRTVSVAGPEGLVPI